MGKQSESKSSCRVEFRQGTPGVLSSTGEEVRAGRHPGRRRDAEETMTSLTFTGALGVRVALNWQGVGSRELGSEMSKLPLICPLRSDCCLTDESSQREAAVVMSRAGRGRALTSTNTSSGQEKQSSS